MHTRLFGFLVGIGRYVVSGRLGQFPVAAVIVGRSFAAVKYMILLGFQNFYFVQQFWFAHQGGQTVPDKYGNIFCRRNLKQCG